MKHDSVNKLVLLLLVLFISALFLAMIRPFLMAIFLAGIFSALATPFYRWLRKKIGGRRVLASIVTLLLLIFLVLLPLSGLLGIVTAQAIKVGESVVPWVDNKIKNPAEFAEFADRIKNISYFDPILPYFERVLPDRETIFKRAGELVGFISRFLIDNLKSFMGGTANFLFMFFIWLYTMFFFLIDGRHLIEKILYYLPLEDQEEQLMLAKFTEVTRATLKGTAVVGILQGGLAGLAFATVGIQAAAFWGTIMAVLSIIPGIGSALVWLPASIVLAAGGHYAKGIGLAVFCGVIVGSVDNFVRPRLVGKDTEMHDLLILFGTLGGIVMFGIVGIIIGPIIAALFTTVWEIYGEAFSEYLPKVRRATPIATPPEEEDERILLADGDGENSGR